MSNDLLLTPGAWCPPTFPPPVLDPWTFAIRDYQNGLLVFGAVPLSLFSGINAMTRERFGRKANIYTDVSFVVGASLAVSNEKRIKAWRAELDIRADHPDWLHSGDVGRSSLTMFSVLAKRPDAFGPWSRDLSAPSDADDFGRCYRLMKRNPEWLDRLPEVVAACPEWAVAGGRWRELSELYEAGKHAEVGAILRGGV